MKRREFIKRGALFVPTVFIPRLIRAQSVLTADGLAAFAPAPVAGGGGGTWTFVSSTVKASTTGNGATTSAINTVGSTLIVIVQSSFGTFPTPTDSKSNSWTLAKNLSSGDGGPTTSRQISIWYRASPITDANHTFTDPGTSDFPVIAVFAFSGGAGGVLDQVNAHANSGAAATCQPGSITPSTANQLIISGFEFKSGTTATVDSGFSTPPKAGSTGTAAGGAGAYSIQTSAGAVNPTWTMGSTDFCTAAIASFK
jgi:hypothetical protein